MVATRRSKVEDEEEKRSRLGWVGDETSDKVRFSEMTDGTTPLPVFWRSTLSLFYCAMCGSGGDQSSYYSINGGKVDLIL